MLRYFLKTFKKLALTAFLFFAVLLLAMAFSIKIGLESQQAYDAPKAVYETILREKDGGRYFTDRAASYLRENDIWAMRLDAAGRVVEAVDKPRKVGDRFSRQDVARFSRFYLEDYPVFTYVAGDGLLILAYPKTAIAKLPANYYHIALLKQTLFLLGGLLFGTVLVFYLLYRLEVRELKRALVPIQSAIETLFEPDYDKLEEHGPLGEVAQKINRANLEYKTLRESRSKWIRGISHDIRTPLAKLNWQLSALPEEVGDTSAMKGEVMAVSRLVEDLNLTMRLESLSREHFERQSPFPAIREVVVDAINDHPDRTIRFESKGNSDVAFPLDAHLFQRMIKNVLLNALVHTSGDVTVVCEGGTEHFSVTIGDEGEGVDPEVIRRLDGSNLAEVKTHGLGLFIARQIAALHGGGMGFKNTPEGLEVRFVFSYDV